MANPYFSYAMAFTISLIAYAFGWSTLYPSLSVTLFLFIAITIALHLLFSFYWRNKINMVYFPASQFLNPVIATIFIYILWTVDFIYEGGIPLVKILTNRPYNYRLFGVPTLHVFTVTFGSFFTVYLFSLFIEQKKKIYLILYLVNLFAALLIYSRAMLLFNISSSVFVYFLKSPRLSWKRICFLVITPTFLIYLFGLLGTIRISFESKEKYNSSTFLTIGQASGSFRNSHLPNEFFWGYIYLSSPLANLQQNINTFSVPPASVSRTFQHIYNEMSFDFISKRINRVLGVERAAENNLPELPLMFPLFIQEVIAINRGLE